jgi:hypothetical protein
MSAQEYVAALADDTPRQAIFDACGRLGLIARVPAAVSAVPA